MKVQFKEWECNVVVSRYFDNKTKAIQLIDSSNGEPIATATVNLPNNPPLFDCVWIKGYSENEGMEQALIDAGIIHPGIKGIAEGGFVTINMYQLTDKAIALWKD